MQVTLTREDDVHCDKCGKLIWDPEIVVHHDNPPVPGAPIHTRTCGNCALQIIFQDFDDNIRNLRVQITTGTEK